LAEKESAGEPGERGDISIIIMLINISREVEKS
jgi:hypothetical protein